MSNNFEFFLFNIKKGWQEAGLAGGNGYYYLRFCRTNSVWRGGEGAVEIDS